MRDIAAAVCSARNIAATCYMPMPASPLPLTQIIACSGSY